MQDKRRTDGSGSVSVWLARPHPYSPPWHRPSQRPHWTVPSDLYNCHGGVEGDEDDHADHADHADYADRTDHEGNDLNNSHGRKEGDEYDHDYADGAGKGKGLHYCNPGKEDHDHADLGNDDLHSCLDEEEDGALKTLMIMIMAKATYPWLKK